MQYDERRIEHEEGTVEIVVYNRAILLFTTDSERLRRIHQVCCRLEGRPLELSYHHLLRNRRASSK